MKFEEFVKFLSSEDSKKERDIISKYFSDQRKNKHLLTYNEWLKVGKGEFLFLTYDLLNLKGETRIYNPINEFIEISLNFERHINNRRLTNNSFVAFPNQINYQTLQNYGNRINSFFSDYLEDFRIYLNIATDFYLHP